MWALVSLSFHPFFQCGILLVKGFSSGTIFSLPPFSCVGFCFGWDFLTGAFLSVWTFVPGFFVPGFFPIWDFSWLGLGWTVISGLFYWETFFNVGFCLVRGFYFVLGNFFHCGPLLGKGFSLLFLLEDFFLHGILSWLGILYWGQLSKQWPFCLV